MRYHELLDEPQRRSPVPRILLAVLATGLVVLALARTFRPAAKETAPEAPQPPRPDLFTPVREAPETFKRDARMPAAREIEVSGEIDLDTFSAGRDLVYVDDPRVWWESDHDAKDNDTEDDHTMHAAMEIPFRRLVNLAAASRPDLHLRVQECFRPAGIHAKRSLHCEGRALDLTFGRDGERLPQREMNAAYEALAKLCWQAGFDWVYYEHARGTGPHIHVSVRRDAPRLSPPPNGQPAPWMLPEVPETPEPPPANVHP